VNCEVCGTELPHGAMFCGECGRAVGARSLARHPDSGMPVVVSPFAPQNPPEQQQHQRDTAIMEPYDLGSLARMPAPPAESVFLHADPPLAREVRAEMRTDLHTDPHARSTESASGSSVDAPARVPESVDASTWSRELYANQSVPGQPVPQVAVPVEAVPDEAVVDAPAAPPFSPEIEQDLPPDLDEPEFVVATSASVSWEPEQIPGARPVPIVEDLASAPVELPDSLPWGDRGSSMFLDSDELEQTLIVPRRDAGERFVLQFSTGESVTVVGTGLLGRNPMPQPGEYFDHLVAITDPGKSVSKTHLEFGQEAGAFWVSDRFSGNGSVVREPEMPVRRLVAGKRYRIVRGTRIDIGEQFLVVS
jgi:hypothetical protein